MEAQTGEKVTDIVLGRPVNFVGSDADQDNQRSVRRLRQAAKMAGLEASALSWSRLLPRCTMV